ncbi:MAG: DUF3868 domain-containing protein [Tannerellaceae bacterium]|jgi:hypothetical protein|nr:DUF3868 domain-containing protein [Tannerellaceae bacterium]
MKVMKVIAGIIISVLFSMLPANLRANEATGTVSIKLNSANVKNLNVNMDMDIKINYMHIGKHESLSLTLALKKGNEIVYLPPVIVNGSNKRKMYERAVNLYGLDAAKGDAYAVLKNDQDLIQFLAYKKDVPYKSWMNRSQLVLIGKVLDYNNNVIGSFTDVLEKSLRFNSLRTARGTDEQSARAVPQQNRNSVSAPPASSSARPMDKVQQYLQQKQQRQTQPDDRAPLRYRQGEYPSQQQNTFQETGRRTQSQQPNGTMQQQQSRNTAPVSTLASQARSVDKVQQYLQQQQQKQNQNQNLPNARSSSRIAYNSNYLL